MIKEFGQTINEIGDLPTLDPTFYENIFKVYQKDDYYFFNILRKVVLINDDKAVDPDLYDNVVIDGPYSWTLISYKEYGTINLWWLICAINNIKNPVKLPEVGSIIKIIKPKYVKPILQNIGDQSMA
jgi:hypothetical protein